MNSKIASELTVEWSLFFYRRLDVSAKRILSIELKVQEIAELAEEMTDVMSMSMEE